jgi:hypothetical protein
MVRNIPLYAVLFFIIPKHKRGCVHYSSFFCMFFQLFGICPQSRLFCGKTAGFGPVLFSLSLEEFYHTVTLNAAIVYVLFYRIFWTRDPPVTV